MKTIEQGIAIVIRYKRYRQGLFTDYGSEIDNWFEYYREELRQCSLFERSDSANTLAIRFRNDKYVIYSTDERAAVWGTEYIYDNPEEATTKYLELYKLLKK